MSKKRHSALWLRFAVLVFATIFAVFAIITLGWYVLFRCGVLTVNPFGRHIPILLLALASLLLGTVIALYVGRLIVRPVQNISEALLSFQERCAFRQSWQ